MLLSVIKDIGGPGSRGFFAVLACAGLLLWFAWPRYRRVWRYWLLTLLTSYLLLSIPLVANSIADLLPVIGASELQFPRSLDVLVVLDGDNMDGRAREAGRVYSMTAPATVWILGGGDLVEHVISAGVPPQKISVDVRDPTTRDQMATVGRLFAEKPTATLALIASRLQMPRIARFARTIGLKAVLLPSPVDTEPARSGLQLLVPSLAALRVSRDALYEHAALAYYR